MEEGTLSFLLRVFLFIPRSLAALDILLSVIFKAAWMKMVSMWERIFEYTWSPSSTLDNNIFSAILSSFKSSNEYKSL
jgi:hypothetical protein